MDAEELLMALQKHLLEESKRVGPGGVDVWHVTWALADLGVIWRDMPVYGEPVVRVAVSFEDDEDLHLFVDAEGRVFVEGYPPDEPWLAGWYWYYHNRMYAGWLERLDAPENALGIARLQAMEWVDHALYAPKPPLYFGYAPVEVADENGELHPLQ